MKIFSDNLFSTNLKTINPSGIYYYITRYIKYSKNNVKNYMKIFKLIQNHVLNCQNKNCPGNRLLPKSLSYSIFTDFKHYSNASNTLILIKFYSNFVHNNFFLNLYGLIFRHNYI